MGTNGLHKAANELDNTINQIIPNILTIKFIHSKPFDGEDCFVSEGTGFVIDSELGIILTNRHIVHSGPFWGFCITDDQKEFKVHPFYRDPIHDFGFLRYDPTKIQFDAIKLRPELIKIGLHVNVVGNDAGERVSILTATIAKLNRNVPEYPSDEYYDFNTFYIQAASNSSGGSSGSPVLDSIGNCVALQAGGNIDSATSYFVPLDRIQRALKHIQMNSVFKPDLNLSVPPRGSILARLLFKSYDELVRIGLSISIIKEIKSKSQSIGLLCVNSLIEYGSLLHKLESGILEVGDILLGYYRNTDLIYIVDFLKLEILCDENIHKIIRFKISRNGKEMELDIEIFDLHQIVSHEYLDYNGVTIQPISFCHCIAYKFPYGSPFISSKQALPLMEKMKNTKYDIGFVIKRFNYIEVDSLECLIKIIQNLGDQIWVDIQLIHLSDPHTRITDSWLHSSHNFNTILKLYTRIDEKGCWDQTMLTSEYKNGIVKNVKKLKLIMDESELTHEQKLIDYASKCFVHVHFKTSTLMAGFIDQQTNGVGFIVDKVKGLCVVPQSIVNHKLGMVNCIFHNGQMLKAKVIFVHPNKGWALIQYDSSLLDTQVEQFILSNEHIDIGIFDQKVKFVGFNKTDNLRCYETKVRDKNLTTIPESNIPKYRSINVLNIILDDNKLLLYGVVCKDNIDIQDGLMVYGFYFPHLGETEGNCNHNGVRNDLVYITTSIRQREIYSYDEICFIDCEFSSLPFWKIAAKIHNNAELRNFKFGWNSMFLSVKRVFDQETKLLNGDIIFTRNDRLVKLGDLDQLTADPLDLNLLRDGSLVESIIYPITYTNNDLDRVVIWAGATIHKPHLAATQQSDIRQNGLYISNCSLGSPAEMFQMHSTMWLTHIDNEPVFDVDGLINKIKKIERNGIESVSVKLINFDKIPNLIGLKLDNVIWPSYHLFVDSHMPYGYDIEQL